MVPATYVFVAIPLNCLNALLIANMLNPVSVSKEEDVVYVPTKEERKDFFSTISNSMLVGAKMVIRHHGNGYRLCGVNGQLKWYIWFLCGWLDNSKNLLCNF